MTEPHQDPSKDDPQSSDAFTVDDYMHWVSSFEELDPEIRYIVISQAGAKFVDGASTAVIKTHQMVLESTLAECDSENLKQRIKQANWRVYEKNKAAYGFAALSVFICICVGVFNLSKLLSHAI